MAGGEAAGGEAAGDAEAGDEEARGDHSAKGVKTKISNNGK